MHYWGFPWFGFVFFFLFFGFAIFNMVMWRRNGGCYRGGNRIALELLEKRYVNGEIDEATFHTMRETLRR